MDDQKKTLFPPPSKVAKFMAVRDVPPNSRLSVPPYQEVDGYRHANVFLRFSHEGADEEPVDLGVIFAFDADGTMGARRACELGDQCSSTSDYSLRRCIRFGIMAWP
jgi:hypothetical protein